jgi:hypothetical protein
MDNDALLALNKRRDTSVEDRRIIFYSCRAAMVNGVVRHGIQAELANQLGFKKKKQFLRYGPACVGSWRSS